MLTGIEDEKTRLRHRIVRMRTILRFAKDSRVEAGMRELIADAEARLAELRGTAAVAECLKQRRAARPLTPYRYAPADR
jgi:hypothetical protein